MFRMFSPAASPPVTADITSVPWPDSAILGSSAMITARMFDLVASLLGLDLTPYQLKAYPD